MDTMASLPMDKAERLKLLKAAAARCEEREALQFGGIEPSRAEVEEAVHDMDTWREESRQNRGEALTSDEA
jgi:hypothetical protein